MKKKKRANKQDGTVEEMEAALNASISETKGRLVMVTVNSFGADRSMVDAMYKDLTGLRQRIPGGKAFTVTVEMCNDPLPLAF